MGIQTGGLGARPLPPLFGSQIVRRHWPKEGNGSGAAIDVSWSAIDGTDVGQWGAAPTLGTAQSDSGLPGARFFVGRGGTVFSTAAAAPLVTLDTQPIQYRPIESQRGQYWRYFQRVLVLPDVAASTPCTGIFGAAPLFTGTPDVSGTPFVALTVTPSGDVEVRRRLVPSGIVTIFANVTQFFPGGDPTQRAFIEWWLRSSNRGQPGRVEIFVDGALAATLEGADLPAQHQMDDRFYAFLPGVYGAQAPQITGELWVGPMEHGGTLVDRAGAPL